LSVAAYCVEKVCPRDEACFSVFFAKVDLGFYFPDGDLIAGSEVPS
jgi:hypothetical protein